MYKKITSKKDVIPKKSTIPIYYNTKTMQIDTAQAIQFLSTISQGEPNYTFLYLPEVYTLEIPIQSHTNNIQKELEKAGSSMDRVLKVNVYLNDLKDYKEMNEVFRGRFGKNPPVRTTIAAAGGIPGDSLVEIDCIAALKKK